MDVFVPSRTFLAYIDSHTSTPSRREVPWEDWGEDGCRIFGDEVFGPYQSLSEDRRFPLYAHAVCGTRQLAVLCPSSPNLEYSHDYIILEIMDFHQTRVSHEMYRSEEINGPNPFRRVAEEPQACLPLRGCPSKTALPYTLSQRVLSQFGGKQQYMLTDDAIIWISNVGDF